jgi:hypothetical protein
MRFISASILILGTITLSIGQNTLISQADLDTLYITTIRSQLELILSSGYKYFEITENTERIKDNVGINIFKVMTNKELIDKSIKDKQQLRVYFLTHQIISNDTIDINLGDKTLTAKRSIHFNHGIKTRKVNIAVSCGGTKGYIPTERFTYDKNTKTWGKIEFVELQDSSDRAKN